MRFSELHCRGDQSVDGAHGWVVKAICCSIRSVDELPHSRRARASGIVRLFSKNDCVIPWGCIETLEGRRLYSGAV